MKKYRLPRLQSLLLLSLLVFSIFLTKANTLSARAQAIPTVGSRRVFLPVILGSGNTAGRQPNPTATLPILPTYTPTSTQLPTATQPPPTATPRPTATPLPTRTATPGGSTAVVLAAGDIARCGSSGDVKTASILSKNSGAILPLGDNAYESGSLTEYQDCYNPSWGAFLNRTMPVTGNHEYLTTGASGYFEYFGAAAGDPSKGYYSYNLGAWHILAINSNCSEVGGCGKGPPQEVFVKNDLAAHPAQCTLAYWHHPFYSSGEWGSIKWTQAIVNDLYNAGAEIILSGHDHDYERFAPQDPNGNLDPTEGIVQFVNGTGGSNLTPWTTIQPNSLARQNSVFGILKLTLNPTSYSWKYISVDGSYSDSGSANCH